MKIGKQNPAVQNPWPGRVRYNLLAADGIAAKAVGKTKPRA